MGVLAGSSLVKISGVFLVVCSSLGLLLKTITLSLKSCQMTLSQTNSCWQKKYTESQCGFRSCWGTSLRLHQLWSSLENLQIWLPCQLHHGSEISSPQDVGNWGEARMRYRSNSSLSVYVPYSFLSMITNTWYENMWWPEKTIQRHC